MTDDVDIEISANSEVDLTSLPVEILNRKCHSLLFTQSVKTVLHRCLNVVSFILLHQYDYICRLNCYKYSFRKGLLTAWSAMTS